MPDKKILVVEDSKPLREVLAERLRVIGYTVLEASGGKEGFKLAQEQKPDMVITDIVMFPMDGLELAKQIRESGDWGTRVHIVALTNLGSSEEAMRVRPLRLSAYLVKADTPLADVVKNVQNILKENKKSSSPRHEKK